MVQKWQLLGDLHLDGYPPREALKRRSEVARGGPVPLPSGLSRRVIPAAHSVRADGLAAGCAIIQCPSCKVPKSCSCLEIVSSGAFIHNRVIHRV